MTASWHSRLFWCPYPMYCRLKPCIVQLRVRLLNADGLSANVRWRQKVTLSLYYAIWITERGRRQNCEKKALKKFIWLVRHFSGIFKKLFDTFRQYLTITFNHAPAELATSRKTFSLPSRRIDGRCRRKKQLTVGKLIS